VEPADEIQPSDVQTSRLRGERLRRWTVAMQECGRRVSERAEAERSRHESVDAVYEMVDRDGEVAGGIIAGALAYRLFIWLLPLGLVLVVGLGLTADAASESPQQAARQVGLLGLVSNSIANAAKSSNRYYALVIGIPILLYVTRSVLRVLVGAHRLVWHDLRTAVPKPTIADAVKLLGLMLALFVAYGLAATAGTHTAGVVGLLVTLVLTLPYAAIWLVVSMRLPHRESPWQALVPGALAFGLGVDVIHLCAEYFVAPYSLAKQGTYGALGTAAVLLLGLFFFSRLIVGAAILNATLWERHVRQLQQDPTEG
jgi:membrane protein